MIAELAATLVIYLVLVVAVSAISKRINRRRYERLQRSMEQTLTEIRRRDAELNKGKGT